MNDAPPTGDRPPSRRAVVLGGAAAFTVAWTTPVVSVLGLTPDAAQAASLDLCKGKHQSNHKDQPCYLPKTGFDLVPVLEVGAVAVAAGAGLMAAGRKKTAEPRLDRLAPYTRPDHEPPAPSS